MDPGHETSVPTIRRAQMRPVEGGVTAAEGFRASAVHCGIRKSHTDLALLVPDEEAAAAGVFTRNRLAAPPVALCREHLSRTGGQAGAVVVNSGNANACTGPGGMEAAAATAAEAARLLGLRPESVLVCSTGVIGVPLPLVQLLDGLPAAVSGLDRHGGAAAAEAILTTDTRTKEAALEVRFPGGVFRIGGMAKGSGMIHPDMATTLAFVTTDLPVPPDLLAAGLRRACERTFNRISVDGDTSTNDAILLLARRSPGVPAVQEGSPAHGAFEEALEEMLRRLALMVVADGEGASRTMEVVVRGAATEDEGLRAARTVCGSLLVKTALHGADPNWGRIAAAVGRAEVDLSPERLAVSIAGIPVLRPGFVSLFDEAEVARRLAEGHVLVEVDLGVGDAEARAWTCDLSAEYVRINADYRT